jgi:Universal stress protein family
MASMSPPTSTPAIVPATEEEKQQNTENADDKPKEPAFGERWKDAAKPVRPSLANMGDGGRRKSSVQFHTAHAEETIRRESLIPVSKTSTLGRKHLALSRRRSSPPPPPTYKRGVTFDTFDNRDATDYSFTMNYKHKDYQHSRRSRTFLCGADEKDYSEYALEWLIDELVEDGDEIVCLRVVESDSKVASGPSVRSGKYREQAKKLLDSVIKKNSQEDKAISLVMELAVGRVQDVIQRMVSRPLWKLYDTVN